MKFFRFFFIFATLALSAPTWGGPGDGATEPLKKYITTDLQKDVEMNLQRLTPEEWYDIVDQIKNDQRIIRYPSDDLPHAPDLDTFISNLNLSSFKTRDVGEPILEIHLTDGSKRRVPVITKQLRRGIPQPSDIMWDIEMLGDLYEGKSFEEMKAELQAHAFHEIWRHFGADDSEENMLQGLYQNFSQENQIETKEIEISKLPFSEQVGLKVKYDSEKKIGSTVIFKNIRVESSEPIDGQKFFRFDTYTMSTMHPLCQELGHKTHFADANRYMEFESLQLVFTVFQEDRNSERELEVARYTNVGIRDLGCKSH